MNVPASWRRLATRPLVLGHRGGRGHVPENTLAAFDAARRAGADGVELDVRLDGDGGVVVLHDRTLARVTAWHEVSDVERLGRRALDRVDVGGGEAPPPLEEVVAWALRHDLRVNVELKHDVSDRRRLVSGALAILERARDAPERFLLSCFHPGVVRALATRSRLPVAWLVHRGQRVARHLPAWQLTGAVGVHPEHVLIDEALVRRFRGGPLVNAWTVNDGARARELAALGVDALIGDRPGDLLAALG